MFGNKGGVSEESLHTLATGVVEKFITSDVPLSDGVKQVMEANGLNRDQTKRLIERTNTEAFLKGFPKTTEFTVADPREVFGEAKLASVKKSEVTPTVSDDSTEMFKVASEASRVHESHMYAGYGAYKSMSMEDIFGVSAEKVASTQHGFDSQLQEKVAMRDKYRDVVYAQQLEDYFSAEKFASKDALEQAENDVWEAYKTAALAGQSTASLEADLVNAFPHMVETMVGIADILTTKLAATQALPVEMYKRASIHDISEVGVMAETPLIVAVSKLIELA